MDITQKAKLHTMALLVAAITFSRFVDYMNTGKLLRLRCCHVTALSLNHHQRPKRMITSNSTPKFNTAADAATFTTYFTCRHNFEKTLMEELQLTVPINCQSIWSTTTTTARNEEKANDGWTTYPHVLHTVSSPFPGLVKAEYYMNDKNDMRCCCSILDPVYALQILPNAVEVCGESISQLAKHAVSGLLLSLDNLDMKEERSNTSKKCDISKELLASPRETLTLHAIVPDMLKGNPKPKMQLRAQTIAKETGKLLQAIYPCTRKGSSTKGESSKPNMEWILQLLLLSPENLAVSLSRVDHCILNNNNNNESDLRIHMSWPCASLTAGLANAEEKDTVDLVVLSKREKEGNLGSAPSSAFRKLIEALTCMGIESVPFGSTAVDLGASPGGWTSVLRKIGFKVTAVDRSSLDKDLMDDGHVSFVSGDAFAFTPSTSPVVLMVSDIIAFPERVSELLEKWCSLNLANSMVVTMKFTGDTPDWEKLRKAGEIAARNGYIFRAKHFFNNKNEVTLMLAKRSVGPSSLSSSQQESENNNYRNLFLPQSMYEIMLPKKTTAY